MYENYYEEYQGIETNATEAADLATSHPVSTNICSDLTQIIDSLNKIKTYLSSEESDETVVSFSSSISSNLATIEAINSFLTSDYVNAEKAYQLLKINLDILKGLDEKLKSVCENEPKQEDYKKEKTETSYNDLGEKIETTVKVNDVEKFNTAHEAWLTDVENIKTDCISVKNKIDECLNYLKSINSCIAADGASGIQAPTLRLPKLNTDKLTALDNIDNALASKFGAGAQEIECLEFTYQTAAGPTTIYYSIIPAGTPLQLAIATDSRGNLSKKFPGKYASEIGAKIAVNIGTFGDGRNGNIRDGGSGICYDGKNLFVGSHYNCDTTLYMNKDGRLGYIDNTMFNDKRFSGLSRKERAAIFIEENDVVWATKGFLPVIDEYTYVNKNTDKNIGSDYKRHPRSFAGQLENGDTIIGSCSGRNTNKNGQYENGMTVKELGDFFQHFATDKDGNKINVRFLWNGDGGGSSAYCIDGKKQNVSGEDRATIDMLYVMDA